MTAVSQAPRALPMTPGRRVALAIGVPVALAVIAATGLSLVADIGQASFPVSLPSIPVRHGQLAVGTGGGDLTVHQGQGGTARLVGTVEYTFVRPTVYNRPTADGTSIAVKCRTAVGNCGLDATLAVPAGVGVALSSGGGNMSVSGIDNSVALASGGGDVTISGVAGTAEVDTGGGNVTAAGLAATLHFTTDGGDVNGTGLAAASVTVASGGGNVTMRFTRAPRNVVVASGGGDVTVVVPRGVTAYHIVSAAAGGGYAVSVPTSSSSPHLISVDSGGGNITITEAG
ncbi:MAG: DUF4097 family beta strand repeat protein [Streptosporangiaceae bacterium]|nr:DUF4097 family beta strand repeat protein [Streptosporangiaceae bacterium]